MACTSQCLVRFLSCVRLCISSYTSKFPTLDKENESRVSSYLIYLSQHFVFALQTPIKKTFLLSPIHSQQSARACVVERSPAPGEMALLSPCTVFLPFFFFFTSFLSHTSKFSLRKDCLSFQYNPSLSLASFHRSF